MYNSTTSHARLRRSVGEAAPTAYIRACSSLPAISTPLTLPPAKRCCSSSARVMLDLPPCGAPSIV